MVTLIKKSYKVIGLMSGTSLDGLDVTYCNFYQKNQRWDFELLKHDTLEYPSDLLEKLKKSTSLTGLELSNLDIALGRFIGLICHDFIAKNKLTIDFISSHGHTVFHQPENGLTLQIGNGPHIAALTKTPVVCDFRSNDIANGGQGAPLVPIGDALLFSEYDSCINIGGFANISYHQNQKRIAFDICPVNIILNWLTQKLDLIFDKDGLIAESGNINFPLLDKLNSMEYYSSNPPKSLGKEWSDEIILPLLNASDLSAPDLLRTYTEHCSIQITNVLNNINIKSLLFTGGGTFNKFLMKRITDLTYCKVVIPKPDIINFKEAIIFGFLGVLRWEEKINCLSSVTGAKRDNVGGAIYLP
jgi:anhydro-N-acetylmuramic acid kinase